MADTPSTDKDTNELPAPEVLKPKGDFSSKDSGQAVNLDKLEEIRQAKKLKRGTYRPSHKSTFIGLGVVVGILAINAAIIGFVIKSQSKTGSLANQSQVSISAATLDKLGVNRSSADNAGIKLIVNPDAQFNGKLLVNGDFTLAGQLKLNGKISAAAASFTTLEAGKTSLTDLNINGDGSVTNFNVRTDLTVAGTSRLEGPTVISSLLTANNVTVTGNLTVSGTMAVSNFHTSSLIVDSTILVGGHVITQGQQPSLVKGSLAVLGTNGTANMSGNDASGTVGIGVGVGATSGGIVASVTFRNTYSNIPHVVITAVGPGVTGVYVNRSATGFSIGINNTLAAGGYAFDYIVEQ